MSDDFPWQALLKVVQLWRIPGELGMDGWDREEGLGVLNMRGS